MRLHVPTPLRWTDLDAYGHVNNAGMLSLLEEARIQAFWVSTDTPEHAVGASTAVIDATPGASTITLIARQEVEYLAPIPYQRQPLDIELWIGHMGGASLDVCYEVYSPVGVEPRVLYTRAVTTIVLVDTANRAPAAHRRARAGGVGTVPRRVAHLPSPLTRARRRRSLSVERLVAERPLPDGAAAGLADLHDRPGGAGGHARAPRA